MSLSYGKKEVSRMVEVLDGEYETVEEAAIAALEKAEEVFADRAKFVVVGQLSGSKERQHIPSSDSEAVKISLGWYSTEGDAKKAAESLWYNTASGDTFRTWVLPVHHGTPADFHGTRKQQYMAAKAKADAAKSARFEKSIADHKAKMEARASEIKALEDAAGGQTWPCPRSVVEARDCKHNPMCK